MSKSRMRDEVLSQLRELGSSFEQTHTCECTKIEGKVTATGHKQGCPVDDAVRLDLAKAGIV